MSRLPPPTGSPTRPSSAGPARPSGEERRLVVRVAPTTHLLFMDVQFSTQYRVMKALSDGTSTVPLPMLGLVRGGPAVPGSPVLHHGHRCVEGQVPPDNIPYTMEGWVIEASPANQERMWWSGIEALAAVHRTDWRSAGLDWLNDKASGAGRASSSRCRTTARSLTGRRKASRCQ